MLGYKTVDGTPVLAQVINFNMKDTKLQDTYTNNIITLCNRNIAEAEVISTWLNLEYPGPYEVSLATMRDAFEVICERAKEIPQVQDCQFLGTKSFEDSCILYKVRVTVPPVYRGPVTIQVNDIVQEVYAAKSISIPLPQVVVHQAADDQKPDSEF